MNFLQKLLTFTFFIAFSAVSLHQNRANATSETAISSNLIKKNNPKIQASLSQNNRLANNIIITSNTKRASKAKNKVVSLIATIKNYNQNHVKIKSPNINTNIDEETTLIPMQSKFSNMQVPYISIKQYLKEFVKGTPYTPDNALKLTVGSNSLFMWQNETGIIYANDPDKLENLNQWKTYSLVDSALANKLLSYLLIIGKSGKISLIPNSYKAS